MKKRWGLLGAVCVFVFICFLSVSFYIRHLESAFLDNIQFYMSEIADRDMKSTDAGSAEWGKRRKLT